METVKIKLGEEVTLKARDVLKDNKSLAERIKGEDCRWHVAGGAVVAVGDLEDDDQLIVKGAQAGRSRISYGPVRAEKEQSNRAQYVDSSARDQVEFDVVVEEVRGAAAGEAPAPLVSSSQSDGLLPMNEPQEEPSERTPYGMDQENKPVAPTPSMVSEDQSNVARQSEDAEPGAESSEDAKPLKGKLPEDFPGHAALEAAGITTYAGVRKQMKGDGLLAVPNVGDATAAKIEEAMGGEEG